MKTIQMLMGCIVALAMAGVARAETYTKPAAITVVNVQGEARYSTDGQAWHPLVIGKILRQGAVLETASDSYVDLVVSGTPVALPEKSSAPFSQGQLSSAPDPNIRGYEAFKPMVQQNVLRMQGNTMLAVDQLTVVNAGADTVGNTELDLRAGHVLFSVKKLSASSQFIIKLPNGVAGIRGATGGADANPDSHAQIECFEGEVTVVIMGRDGKLIKENVMAHFVYDSADHKLVVMVDSLRGRFTQFCNAVQTYVFQNVTLVQDNGTIYVESLSGRVVFTVNPVTPPSPPSGGG